MSMMEDARSGCIDIIYTKSISRFAQNTVLLLNSIRELKACGVAVFFEEQSSHTLHAEGELLLSVLGSVAEEERRSTSANIQWTYRSRFQNGDTGVISRCPYGYCRERDGTLAKVVRRIFRQYLKGTSASQIAQELNDLDVPTETGHVWSSQRILRILSNEKCMGDFRMQKAFVGESGIVKINRGQLAQYYVTSSHKGIISKRDWEAAQRIREERKPKSYLWTGKLKCALCGASLIRKLTGWTCLWICTTYMHRGIAACEGTKIPEQVLETSGIDSDELQGPLIAEGRYAKCKEAGYRFTPACRSW